LAACGQSDGQCELERRAADGEAVPAYMSAIDLLDEGQRIISGIVADLR
jgi:hypothetical protein